MVARGGVGIVCGIAGGVEWVDIVGAGGGGCGVWGGCCGLYSTSSRGKLGWGLAVYSLTLVGYFLRLFGGL